MKKIILLSCVFIIICIIIGTSFYNKKKKYTELRARSGVQVNSSIEAFYLNNGYFPKSFKQIANDFKKRFNDNDYKNNPFILDPFTNDYYKLILVKSEKKDRNGVLTISAGFNNIIDNNISEVSIKDVHKMKLIKKEVNNWDYKPPFLEYFISDKDIIVDYYCDEFQYLTGQKIKDFSKLSKIHHICKTNNTTRRLFIQGRVSSLNFKENSLKLYLNGVEVNCYNVLNLKGITIGDNIHVSALLDPSVENGLIKCKIYSFELNRLNIMNYTRDILKDIGFTIV